MFTSTAHVPAAVTVAVARAAGAERAVALVALSAVPAGEAVMATVAPGCPVPVSGRVVAAVCQPAGITVVMAGAGGAGVTGGAAGAVGGVTGGIAAWITGEGAGVSTSGPGAVGPGSVGAGTAGPGTAGTTGGVVGTAGAVDAPEDVLCAS
jgi:hypothetical protein